MKVLYLTIKAKWFDMIASGEKKEEYREIKPFWEKRLVKQVNYEMGYKQLNASLEFKPFTHVCFARGGHFHPTIPQMTIELLKIATGTGNPEWGAEPGKKYFVIKLGNIL